MSDVFSSLCSFGRNKKKNSVVNSVTVVGVKKALLLGKISVFNSELSLPLSISPPTSLPLCLSVVNIFVFFLSDEWWCFLGLLSNNEERKGFDGALYAEEEQTSDSSSDQKNTKTSCDFSNTRSVHFHIGKIPLFYKESLLSKKVLNVWYIVNWILQYLMINISS